MNPVPGDTEAAQTDRELLEGALRAEAAKPTVAYDLSAAFVILSVQTPLCAAQLTVSRAPERPVTYVNVTAPQAQRLWLEGGMLYRLENDTLTVQEGGNIPALALDPSAIVLPDGIPMSVTRKGKEAEYAYYIPQAQLDALTALLQSEQVVGALPTLPGGFLPGTPTLSAESGVVALTVTTAGIMSLTQTLVIDIAAARPIIGGFFHTKATLVMSATAIPPQEVPQHP
jgi:hypothetical protein